MTRQDTVSSFLMVTARCRIVFRVYRAVQRLVLYHVFMMLVRPVRPYIGFCHLRIRYRCCSSFLRHSICDILIISKWFQFEKVKSIFIMCFV